MAEEDLARAQPGEVGTMARKTEALDAGPGQPPILAGGAVHRNPVPAQGGVERPILQLHHVRLCIQPHAATLANRNGGAPGTA